MGVPVGIENVNDIIAELDQTSSESERDARERQTPSAVLGCWRSVRAGGSWRRGDAAGQYYSGSEAPARESGVQMLFARWPRRGSHQNAALVASALIGALLLSVAARALHDCHDHGHAPCAVCWHAKVPICAPEVSPPPPVPEMWPQLIVLPTARPTCRPLFTFAARGPPVELL